MSQESESSKNKEKSETSDESEQVEEDVVEAVDSSESSDDAKAKFGESEEHDPTPSDEKSLDDEQDVPNDKAGVTSDVSTAAEDADADESETAEDDQTYSNEDASHESDVPEEADLDQSIAATEVAAVPESRRASAMPVFLGGAVAAGLGYLAALFAQPQSDTDVLSESISSNTSQIESLSSDVAVLQEFEVPAVDMSPIEQSLSELSERFGELSGDLTALREDMSASVAEFGEASASLSDRVTVLETAGPGESEAAQATEQDLAAFRAELERISSEAEAKVAASMERASQIEQAALANVAEAEDAAALAEQQAADAAAQAERNVAINAVMTALESGQGFSDYLATLGEVPEVLTQNSETGVTTLIELQQSFSDAARGVLTQAEAIPQDASAGERLTAFIKQRTNARSLTPKEGNSSDAILSRAEAMMKQGDVAGALVELDALGDPAKSAMQSWLDQANTREAALAAAEQLTATN